jgi:erythritol ABC transporter membrane protein
MAPNFVTVANAVIVSKHVAINAFLAIGMTFVILTGGIDLSSAPSSVWSAWSPARWCSTAFRSKCSAW